jgi:hypothetical protein
MLELWLRISRGPPLLPGHAVQAALSLGRRISPAGAQWVDTDPRDLKG